eukprot:6178112-Pleurochrysis_carterae.AAC.1
MLEDDRYEDAEEEAPAAAASPHELKAAHALVQPGETKQVHVDDRSEIPSPLKTGTSAASSPVSENEDRPVDLDADYEDDEDWYGDDDFGDNGHSSDWQASATGHAKRAGHKADALAARFECLVALSPGDCGAISHAAGNSLDRTERRAQTARPTGLTRDERATTEHVLDPRTRLLIFKVRRAYFQVLPPSSDCYYLDTSLASLNIGRRLLSRHLVQLPAYLISLKSCGHHSLKSDSSRPSPRTACIWTPKMHSGVGGVHSKQRPSNTCEAVARSAEIVVENCASIEYKRRCSGSSRNSGALAPP